MGRPPEDLTAEPEKAQTKAKKKWGWAKLKVALGHRLHGQGPLSPNPPPFAIFLLVRKCLPHHPKWPSPATIRTRSTFPLIYDLSRRGAKKQARAPCLGEVCAKSGFWQPKPRVGAFRPQKPKQKMVRHQKLCFFEGKNCGKSQRTASRVERGFKKNRLCCLDARPLFRNKKGAIWAPL
jgi:hypothetical protein